MVNFYKVKKWSAGCLMSFMPVMSFLIFIIFTDLLQSIAAVILTVPLSIVLGFRLMKHPLHEYLEGKGLLVQTLDSTGVMENFIVQVENPYITGKHRGIGVSTIFNRDAVFYSGPPKKARGAFIEDSDFDVLTLKIPKANRHEHLFGYGSFPVLLYNKNLQTFLTKDSLGTGEKNLFIKHQILYLNRKVEDLTASLRDFARYIVEQTRPRQSLFSSGLFKIILIGGVIALIAVLALPFILNTMEGVVAPAVKGSGSIINR
jgi:hypothetical protein